MNTVLMPVKQPVPAPAPVAEPGRAAVPTAVAPSVKLRWQTILTVPVATAMAAGIHFAVRKNDPEPDTTSYLIFLGGVAAFALVCSVVQSFSQAVRRWMAHMFPIFAA